MNHQIQNSKFKIPQRGFITLISVLVVAAVGLSVATSLILLGVGSSRTSFALDQSSQAKALANSCAERALELVRQSSSFSGTGNINLGNGACSYTVTNTGGQNRTIASSGTVGTIVRKVSITIDVITPAIHISSWQEVAN